MCVACTLYTDTVCWAGDTSAVFRRSQLHHGDVDIGLIRTDRMELDELNESRNDNDTRGKIQVE